MSKEFKIHPETKIGHIHFTVSNLQRSLKFYKDILGFEITQWHGNEVVFLSAGGYHHHIGLNTWAGEGAKPPPPGHTGLYHFAILFPSRKELAKVLKRLMDAEYSIDGMSDHGVSEAIYLHDPDQNGIELYADRPKKDWPKDKEGNLMMITKGLNIKDLLDELK